MSWGALPFWVYQVQYEQFLAKALGAMQEELEAEVQRLERRLEQLED